MRSRLLLVPVLFAAASGAARTQPPSSLAPDLRALLVPTTPLQPPVAPEGYRISDDHPLERPVAVPAEKSIEQLMDQLAVLRTQKAQLERQEQEVVKEIRQKLEKQTSQLQQLGICPAIPIRSSITRPLPPADPAKQVFTFGCVGLFSGK